MKLLKTIFIGTGSFAAPILDNIAQDQLLEIGLVITTPDKPVGRKKTITPPPVKEISLKHKLSFIQPEKISALTEKILDFNPDLIIIADYGQIIPSKIIEIPRLGSVNIHPSLLPKYRGPAPIQAPLLNGDKTTGITIMLIDEKVDHGPILNQMEVPIADTETALTLREKLAQKSGPFLIETLNQYAQGKIKPKKQNDQLASFTQMFTRQDGKVDFQQETAQAIERKIRAFDPWPGVWTTLGKKRVKIIKAKIASQPDDKKLVIKIKKGYLEIEIIQPEGKKPMTGQEFARGH